MENKNRNDSKEQVRCYYCKGVGHIATSQSCPNYKKDFVLPNISNVGNNSKGQQKKPVIGQSNTVEDNN